MNARRHFALFAVVAVVIAGAILLALYLISGIVNSPATEQAGSSGRLEAAGTVLESLVSGNGLTVLNLALTVILFILLTFSVLNIYSVFNAQIDREKSDLRREISEARDARRTAQDELRGFQAALEEVVAAVREVETDLMYERQFQRVMSSSLPTYARASSAGFFVTHRPRDYDLDALRALHNEIQELPGLEPVRDQIRYVLRKWS